jgi:RND family efflux transporter MFP subunit
MTTGKKIIRNIILAVIAIGLITFVVIKLTSNKKKINEKNKVVDRSSIAVPVNTFKVAMQPVNGNFSLPAVIEPETEADITLNSAGKIKNLNFKLGSVVRKGQVLGSIDNSLKEINLRSTELLLAKAKKDFERIESLYQGNASTEIDYLNAKYNYENTQTQVDLIKQQIADGTLIAPISGIVTKKNLEPGEFVNMGMSVATIVDVNSLKVKVMVGESNIYQVTPNMTVDITCDIYPDKIFRGTVRYVSPRGDESHNYEVEIAIKNEKGTQLKGGTFVKVNFDIENKGEVLQIPKLALVEGVKNPYVYVAKNNKAEQRKITVGRELGESIEVLGGLEAGEEVITSGQINLSNGSVIEIINNTAKK